MTRKLTPEEKARNRAKRQAEKERQMAEQQRQQQEQNEEIAQDGASNRLGTPQVTQQTDESPAETFAEEDQTEQELDAQEQPEQDSMPSPTGKSKNSQKPSNALEQLIKACSDLRREHRSGAGYSRIYADNVARALDRYEKHQ